MAADESLIEVERGQPYYYLPDLFVAENYIASRIAEMVGELVFEPENADQLIDAEAVSYTHLDVYKRQPIHITVMPFAMRLRCLKFPV